MAILDWFSQRIFHTVHRHNLVYNTCWEDPRLDREALQLTADDSVLVITSAGCNALDYVLQEPNHVYAVDVNPRQNALLELKIAAIRRLSYEDFFAMFGRGRLSGAKSIYADRLHDLLSPFSQKYWDKRIKFFDHPRRTFYYRGTSGYLARWAKFYIDRVARIRPAVEALLDASDLDQQRQAYGERIERKFWSFPIRFAINRDLTLAMMGVPREQRRQVDSQHDGGIGQFARDSVAAVFSEIPLDDNYFWRVYMTGSYTPDCCPEYLKRDNFPRLRDGLVDRISIHTNTVQGFLEQHRRPISRFVLLDHMDWMADRHFPQLEDEWQAIVDRATPDARVIWRSGGFQCDFVDRVHVDVNGRRQRLGDLLNYRRELADELHARDRVHTYGCFCVADLETANKPAPQESLRQGGKYKESELVTDASWVS